MARNRRKSPSRGKKTRSNSKKPSAEYESLRCADLRQLLKEKGLSTKGRKAELIERLNLAVEEDEYLIGEEQKGMDASFYSTAGDISMSSGGEDDDDYDHAEDMSAVLAGDDEVFAKLVQSLADEGDVGGPLRPAALRQAVGAALLLCLGVASADATLRTVVSGGDLSGLHTATWAAVGAGQEGVMAQRCLAPGITGALLIVGLPLFAKDPGKDLL